MVAYQHIIISLHHSIDGVNHLIDGVNHLINFELNRTIFLLHRILDPFTSPDLHVSPRGLVDRFIFTTLLPETPAGSSSSSRRFCLCLSSLRLTFVDLRFFSRRLLETNKRKRRDRVSIHRPLALHQISGSALTHYSTTHGLKKR